jgi:hypothetical protein
MLTMERFRAPRVMAAVCLVKRQVSFISSAFLANNGARLKHLEHKRLRSGKSLPILDDHSG